MSSQWYAMFLMGRGYAAHAKMITIKFLGRLESVSVSALSINSVTDGHFHSHFRLQSIALIFKAILPDSLGRVFSSQNDESKQALRSPRPCPNMKISQISAGWIHSIGHVLRTRLGTPPALSQSLRGRPPLEPKKCPKQSRKSLLSLKTKFFETPDTCLNCFGHFLDPADGRPRETLSETLRGVRARRGWETPVRGRRDPKTRLPLTAHRFFMKVTNKSPNSAKYCFFVASPIWTCFGVWGLSLPCRGSCSQLATCGSLFIRVP